VIALYCNQFSAHHAKLSLLWLSSAPLYVNTAMHTTNKDVTDLIIFYNSLLVTSRPLIFHMHACAVYIV